MMTMEEFSKLTKSEQEALLKKASEIEDKLKGLPNPEAKPLSMQDFEGKIEEAVKKFIQPMTNVDRKYYMFPGIGTEGKDDTTPQGKYGKTIRFLKALSRGDVQTMRGISEEVRVKANLSEGTTTAGGFLVPEEFKAEVLRLAEIYGVVRQNCRIIPMAYDVLNIPAAGTTDLTAHWTNEASQIYTTLPNFRQVTLTINKLASIPKVTNELLSDANVDVVSYMSQLVAEQFAKGEDTQGLIGVGSPFVGAVNATGVPTYPHMSGTGFQTLSYQDLVYTPSKVKASALSNAKFYFHRTMIAHIQGLITTAGAPIFPSMPNSVVGYPLVSCEVLPGVGHAAYQTDATTYALFGDLRQGLLMGERGTLEMKIGTEGTVLGDNLFEKDMVALRFIERVCFGVALPSAFCVIQC
jgi:HK97 family phage major capsid protein